MRYLDVVVVVEELGESQRRHDSAISLIILSCAEINLSLKSSNLMVFADIWATASGGRRCAVPSSSSGWRFLFRAPEEEMRRAATEE